MKIGRFIGDLRNRSLATRLSLLGAGLLAPYAVGLAVAVRCSGAAGLAALSVAAAGCLVSATAAMILSYCLQTPATAMAAALLSMAVRTGLPLIVALVVRLGGPSLVEAGFVYYLLVFYVLALAIEVPLSLPRMERSRPYSETTNPKHRNSHG
jgi:hypothetical protein